MEGAGVADSFLVDAALTKVLKGALGMLRPGEEAGGELAAMTPQIDALDSVAYQLLDTAHRAE